MSTSIAPAIAYFGVAFFSLGLIAAIAYIVRHGREMFRTDMADSVIQINIDIRFVPLLFQCAWAVLFATLAFTSIKMASEARFFHDDQVKVSGHLGNTFFEKYFAAIDDSCDHVTDLNGSPVYYAHNADYDYVLCGMSHERMKSKLTYPYRIRGELMEVRLGEWPFDHILAIPVPEDFK